jgi:cytochrome P450
VYPDGHVGWIVGGYDLARSVLADPRFSARAELKRAPLHRPGVEPFIGQPALPGWFIDMDPPQHTVFRRLLAGYFTMARMRSLQPKIEQIVDGCLTDTERRGPPADLVETFTLPSALQVLCEVLGIPYAERDVIRRHREIIFSLDATREDGLASMHALTGLLLEMTAAKRADPGDGLLGGLVSSGRLSHDEIAGAGVLLLTAGHDTVASMLGLGTVALLLNPVQRARVDWDGPIDSVVDELLRYLSILHLGVPRMPTEDVELGGQVVKAGQSVTVAIPSANRDLLRFTDPEVLDLSRAEGGNLAFGHGLHQCIGQNLARVQLRVGFPALFRRFPRLRLAVPPDAVHVVRDGAIYSLHELPVSW